MSSAMASHSNLTRQQIQASNIRIDAGSYPRTAVFVGGTSGIGEATIRELVKAGTKDKSPIRIYIIGRKESAERTNKSLDKLRAQYPHTELIFTQGDVSLLGDVKRLCTELKEKEKSLDLLFLSTGYSPLGGREGKSTPCSHAYFTSNNHALTNSSQNRNLRRPSNKPVHRVLLARRIHPTTPPFAQSIPRQERTGSLAPTRGDGKRQYRPRRSQPGKAE